MMKMFRVAFAGMMMFTFLLAGCTVPSPWEPSPPETSPLPAEYKKITQEEAQALMTAATVILDVRTQEEYDEGHIKNAILLPDYEVKGKADALLTDKGQTILVYCRTGRRSALAAQVLVDMGYTRVYDFGGIVDWRGEIVG